MTYLKKEIKMEKYLKKDRCNPPQNPFRFWVTGSDIKNWTPPYRVPSCPIYHVHVGTSGYTALNVLVRAIDEADALDQIRQGLTFGKKCVAEYERHADRESYDKPKLEKVAALLESGFYLIDRFDMRTVVIVGRDSRGM